MANYKNDCKNLLHPELMSNEQLIEILTLRCIKLSDKERLNRCELINLYSRIALPLEQRSSRHSTINGNKSDESPAKSPTATQSPPCAIPSRKIKLNRSSLYNSEYESQRKMIKVTNEEHKMDSATKNGLKRDVPSCDEKQQEPVAKKARQKITWP